MTKTEASTQTRTNSNKLGKDLQGIHGISYLQVRVSSIAESRNVRFQRMITIGQQDDQQKSNSCCGGQQSAPLAQEHMSSFPSTSVVNAQLSPKRGGKGVQRSGAHSLLKVQARIVDAFLSLPLVTRTLKTKEEHTPNKKSTSNSYSWISATSRTYPYNAQCTDPNPSSPLSLPPFRSPILQLNKATKEKQQLGDHKPFHLILLVPISSPPTLSQPPH